MAAIAQSTERMEVGSYILNASVRPPLLTALSAIDLDELLGGRLVLGLGSGNKHINADWFNVSQSRPLKYMEEYVSCVRRMIQARSGEMVCFEGQIHKTRWTASVDPVRPTVPIILAAGYPKMMQLAGRVADGVGLVALMSPSYIREVIRPLVLKAAEAADRDPEAFRVFSSPFVAIHENEDEARNSIRRMICNTFHPVPHPYLEFTLREQGYSRLVDDCSRALRDGDVEAAMAAILDETIDEISVCGPLHKCREALGRFAGALDDVLLTNADMSPYIQHRDGGYVSAAVAHADYLELGRAATEDAQDRRAG